MSIIDQYINGFEGAPINAEHRSELITQLPQGIYGNYAHAIDGSGKGKVALPFKHVLKFDPQFGGCEAQTTGDCTSHGARNAGMITYCNDIILRKQAEIYKGRFATEPIYGHRGFSGQGMSPSRAAEFISKVSGFHIRKKYASVDLSVYNSSIGSNWGGRGTPKDVIEDGKPHNMLNTSLVNSIDEAIDLVYNGYGLTIASNYGFSNKRDKNGICVQQGSWNHQMSIIGMDDSGQRHKNALFLIQNSWGPNWVGGPKVYDQPDGSFWIYADILLGMIRSGECWAFSGFNGFASADIDWSEFDAIF